jgi:hypothetical protein
MIATLFVVGVRRTAVATLLVTMVFTAGAVQISGLVVIGICRSGRQQMLGYFCVRGRLHMIKSRPRPALFRCEAATARPAFICRLAAASMILARKRLTAIFRRCDCNRHRQADRGSQIGTKRQRNADAKEETRSVNVRPSVCHDERAGARLIVVRIVALKGLCG